MVSFQKYDATACKKEQCWWQIFSNNFDKKLSSLFSVKIIFGHDNNDITKCYYHMSVFTEWFTSVPNISKEAKYTMLHAYIQKVSADPCIIWTTFIHTWQLWGLIQHYFPGLCHHIPGYHNIS